MEFVDFLLDLIIIILVALIIINCVIKAFELNDNRDMSCIELGYDEYIYVDGKDYCIGNNTIEQVYESRGKIIRLNNNNKQNNNNNQQIPEVKDFDAQCKTMGYSVFAEIDNKKYCVGNNKAKEVLVVNKFKLVPLNN